MLLKAIIFDFDDTLIESTVHFVRTARRVAKKLGLRVPETRDFVDFGQGWEDFIRKTWPGTDIDFFTRHYKADAENVVYSRYPGVNRALRSLKDDYRLYILTKRPRDFMNLRIAQSGLDTACFRWIYTNEDLEYQKPDPRTFDAMADELHACGKERTVYVGDHLDDMKAALGAGLRFVAVQTGFFKKPDFLKAGLDVSHILQSVADLPGWIKKRQEVNL